jgi:site-specific DNA recombinase
MNRRSLSGQSSHSPLPVTRAAIYTRIARADQTGQPFSLQAQAEACRLYAQTHDYTVDSEYEDCGASGNSLNRPGLNALREAAQHGDIDVVIVYSLDRLVRNLLVLLQLQDEWRQTGTSIVCVRQEHSAHLIGNTIAHDRDARCNKRQRKHR